MINKNYRTIFFICLVAVFTISFNLFTTKVMAEKYHWRFALEEIEGSFEHQVGMKFKEFLEKKSNGEIKVDLYPYGQLGTIQQMCELTMKGALEFTFATPGHLGAYIPETQIFVLHYLFPPDRSVLKKMLKESDAIYTFFNPLYEKQNLKLLALVSEGWQTWTTNKLIKSPEDMKGFKMRVMKAPLLIEAYKAYGANPTPLSFAEVYSALQLKMVDGQANAPFVVQEMKFYEVTDYIINAYQLMYVTGIMANKKFYEGLPPDIQSLVNEGISLATDFAFELENKINDERMAMILKAKPDYKSYEFTLQEVEAFAKLALSVHDKYAKMVGPKGKELLDSMKKEIKTLQNKNQ